jgi:MFS family permease
MRISSGYFSGSQQGTRQWWDETLDARFRDDEGSSIQSLDLITLWISSHILRLTYHPYPCLLSPSIGLSTASNISWIGALTVFFLLSIPLWSGAASDTGHFKLVLRVGIGLWLVGIFMTSICKEYWQFVLAQGFCIGFANGCMFVPMVSVISTYFDATKRSFAISITLCGSGTGGLVIPIMLNRLIDRIGFGWAVRTLGFMALCR